MTAPVSSPTAFPTTLRIACGQVRARDLLDAAGALDEALSMVAAAGRAGASLCVLPEATYPAYVLGSAAAAREVIARGPDPVATFADAARTAGCAVVVGLVLEAAQGLENAAVLIDAQGTVLARAAKRFLWHFDRAWFVPGSEGPVHALEGRTPVGMLVCADARLPEIATDLVARGARIVANPTAWVTSMPPPEGKNSQAEFLWRVRALENGVVAVAATKVGTEADTVIYAGRSQIVAADGRVVAVASASEPELLVTDVEVPADGGDRRATASPRATKVRRPELRAGYLQVAVLTHDDLLDGLEEHGIDVAVGPGGVLRSGDPSGDRSQDAALASFADDELLDPGAARAAALEGAELVVWLARRVSTPFVEEVARTRALENRVFVLLWQPPERGGPCVVDPSGAVIARAGAERFAVQASCLRAAVATKTMAPGTDAWEAVDELFARRVPES